MKDYYLIGKRNRNYVVESKWTERYCQAITIGGVPFEELPPEVIADKDLKLVWFTERDEFPSFSEALNYMLTESGSPKVKKDILPNDCVSISSHEDELLTKVLNAVSALERIKDITCKF